MSQQGIEYSNELVYRKGCPASMNRVKYDEQRHLLKEMSKSDRIVYDATIKLNKEGFMAPVMVQEDDIHPVSLSKVDRLCSCASCTATSGASPGSYVAPTAQKPSVRATYPSPVSAHLSSGRSVSLRSDMRP